MSCQCQATDAKGRCIGPGTLSGRWGSHAQPCCSGLRLTLLRGAHRVCSPSTRTNTSEGGRERGGRRQQQAGPPVLVKCSDKQVGAALMLQGADAPEEGGGGQSRGCRGGERWPWGRVCRRDEMYGRKTRTEVSRFLRPRPCPTFDTCGIHYPDRDDTVRSLGFLQRSRMS